MANAMAGASANIAKGNAAASVSTRKTSRRLIATSGDESSTTGSSAQADIDHSETRPTPAASASTAGSSKGSQNASTAKRRCGVGAIGGHAISLSAAPLGRATRVTISSGAATEAALPVK